MDTDFVAPATPTEPTAPVETPAEPSIADHEAAFGKGARNAEPVIEGTDVGTGASQTVERPRHRAKKDIATPADVPRIAELTRKLRDAERERDEWKTKVSSTPAQGPAPQQPPPVSITPNAQAETATDEPTWESFEAKIGSDYQTWGAAQNAWMKAWRSWDKAEVQKTAESQQQSQAYQSVLQGYSAKAQVYGKTQPDFFDKMAAAKDLLDGIPDLLFQAIVRDDNGPEIAYALVTRPDQLDEMCLLTDGKAVTSQSVALLQRRLSHYRAPAAATGSVATTPPRIASRPPNPVRTGPLNTGDELPGDDASIAEHERAFGKKRRR